MPDRLIGNDKVPNELQRTLKVMKALKQGRELAALGRDPAWWPALDALSPEDQRLVRNTLMDEAVWKAHSALIARYSPTHRIKGL